MLIFENMPIKFCETMPKMNKDIKYTISYHKSISDKVFECAHCHKIIKCNDIYGLNPNDDNNENSNENSSKETNLYFAEKENNIFCKSCLNEMRK